MATITVCDTCAFSAEEKTQNGQTGGEIFAALLEERAGAAVRVRRHSCLMGCGHPCNAAVSDKGKLTYVLGGFEPSPAAAAALIEYAEKFAQSETGVVPFRQWPQGVKGKFISRVPPL
jgi:predicted metal-binding protein